MKEIFNESSNVGSGLQRYATKLVLGERMGGREGERERERERERRGGREREGRGERDITQCLFHARNLLPTQ